MVEEIDIALIKKKSITGVVALTSRTFILQIIAFGSTFLLTIFLSPQMFGVFYVVSAIIAFLNYFSDIGLAAALIQKKESLTDDDLATTFTIQQLLVGLTVVLAFLFSGMIGSFYRLDSQGLGLLRALIFSFFLSSLKTIPSVLLERKLEFNKLIIPQILETLGFYVVAVILAWQGAGVASFTWAVLTRAIIGLVAIYVVSPWMISIRFSPSVAKRLMRFGVPFQLNSFIALLKDDLLTVFLGKVLPFAEVGYIGWAKKWAEVPLRLIMDNIIRVTFPAFSRLQESKEQLRSAIEKTLYALSITIFPISVGLFFFVRPLIHIIPRYNKWEPAVMSFYFLTFAVLLASLSTPLTNALNAIGKIKITLGLMVMWTALTWILVIFGIRMFGFTGVPLALALVSTTLWVVIMLLKRYVAFSFTQNVFSALLASILQGVFYLFLIVRVPEQFGWLTMIAVLGAILYGVVLWIIDRARLEKLIASFRSTYV